MHASGSECASETRTRAGRGVLSRRHACQRQRQRIDDRWKNAGDATAARQALVVVAVIAAPRRARDRARSVATNDRRRHGFLKRPRQLLCLGREPADAGPGRRASRLLRVG